MTATTDAGHNFDCVLDPCHACAVHPLDVDIDHADTDVHLLLLAIQHGFLLILAVDP